MPVRALLLSFVVLLAFGPAASAKTPGRRALAGKTWSEKKQYKHYRRLIAAVGGAVVDRRSTSLTGRRSVRNRPSLAQIVGFPWPE